MGGKQKRANEDVTIKRKKAKKVKYDSEKIADTEDPKPEILDIKTVREGMLLLGCITNIRRTSFDVSLPGCISGVVEANNISNEFSKVVATADDADLEMFSIDSVIEVGMVLPFKVIKIDHDSHKGRKTAQIFLSMKPDDINSNLKPSSLFHKMVLFVSICSIEDHGFVVDVGIESVRGFLPKCNCDSEVLQVGQVIPTCIQNILFSDKKSAKIQLYKLDFNQEFPKVSVENIKLHSILPGAKICADVIDVQKHFVIMKYLDFDVCASLFSNGSINTSIHTGNRVEGTVLFVNPITNMIHLALHSTTIPKLFPQWFQLKKFETVGNPKFLYFYKNRAYYKISKGIYGFINIWDLPAAESGTATMLSLAKISKACVLSLHYMDKLIQMTAKPSITAKTIILPDEVNIGDILDAVVQRHEEDGMFVRICIGLYGFVRRLHMADIYVTKPEALFPVGKNVRCRVLCSDGKGKINLTCKESLLDIHKSCLLSSYERVKKNEFYTGVVVKICDTYILVLFFNNVKGIVSTPHISPGAVFFTGQTVVCKVLECNPETKKLKLSLLTEGLSSNDQIKQDKMSKQSVKRFPKGVSNISHPSSSKQLNKNRKILETSKSDEIDLSDEEKIVDSSKGLNSHLCSSNSPKPVQAVIKNVKGHQLNILLKSARGRVHITELECTSEGIYPLKEFSSNQKIQVYVIGEFVGKRINFLEINHRNKTIYKECSLKYPPVAYSVDFKCGDSVIGFVKEAHDVCATLWLSPTETGVLDYLHFSKNPKVVRKLRQHLKIGLSLKVSILDNTFQKRKNGQCFSLTKIENYRPEVDKNILGLVQIACLDRGLIVKLPFGYHGSVSVTDLTDVYVPVHNLFKKYQKLKFMLCHVLKVDHQTKYCSLSLRKTRLFPKITMCDSFCPEMSPQNIKQGDSVKGLVKFASDSSVTVAIGRNLEGKLGLHSCSLTDCRSCKVAKGIINKYPAGSVIDVIIQGASDNNKTFILAHSEFNFGKNPKCGRLSVEEDITWEEMQ